MLDSLISKTSKVLKSIKAGLDDLEEHLFKTTIFCSNKIRYLQRSINQTERRNPSRGSYLILVEIGQCHKKRTGNNRIIVNSHVHYSSRKSSTKKERTSSRRLSQKYLIPMQFPVQVRLYRFQLSSLKTAQDSSSSVCKLPVVSNYDATN